MFTVIAILNSSVKSCSYTLQISEGRTGATGTALVQNVAMVLTHSHPCSGTCKTPAPVGTEVQKYCFMWQNTGVTAQVYSASSYQLLDILQPSVRYVDFIKKQQWVKGHKVVSKCGVTRTKNLGSTKLLEELLRYNQYDAAKYGLVAKTIVKYNKRGLHWL